MAKNKYLSGLLYGVVVCFCLCTCGTPVSELGKGVNDRLCRETGQLCHNSVGLYHGQGRFAENLYSTKQNTDMEQRQKVKALYNKQIGVREATGHNDGPQVEAYLRYTGLGKGNAWCAAFVCWVLGQAGVENPRTAWAASLFPKEKLVWKQGRIAKSHQVQSEKRRDCFTPTLVAYASVRNDLCATGNPQLATIFGLYFPSLKRIAHCGFIDQWGEKEVITVEGNTNDSGSREGSGVYRKRRPVKSLYAVADWIGKEHRQ